MKKRSFITLLAVIFCVTLAAGIAACRSGGSGGSGNTDDKGGSVNTDDKGGSGNTHIHSYSEEWSCDAEYHWHDPVCYHSADEEVPVADKAPHEYEDGVCKVCKYIDDLLIVPQSRKLIEDKIAPVLFADRDEKTILSQNWQLITDNKNEYLTGLAATYIYATEEHTHVVNIDTISFTKFSLENLVGAKFTEFDKDSIKTENKKSLTASLIKTWEVNADEQRKAEALKNLSVADGYENTVRTLFCGRDGKNFLLECNAGTTRINSSAYADTTRINSSAYADTKIEGRQVTELEYTVREHKYTTDNLCAATDCGYDGLEYEEIEGGYAITGTGELDKSKLKILNLSPIHKDRTVKKIGNGAFSGCANLETVRIIGNNNAYIEEIGSRAFEGCERLYDFAWQKSLTSIGDYAFKDCVSLYRVQLEGTPQIGSGAFSGCEKIIEVYCMYDDLTEGSSSYGGIASYAKHVYGPNIEGHKSDSSRVWKSVNGDSEPFAGATFIFYNNKQENYLLGLDGGSFNFTTTDKLILPKKLAHLGYSTEKYEVYDYAFAHFDEIKSVEIPDSVNSIGKYAFYDCTADIKWGDNPSIKEIGQYAFSGYKGTSISIPDSVTSIGYWAFWNCTSLTSITIPDSVTSIGWCAFRGCTSLENITIPDSVTSIESSAFSDCSSLESITIPNGVTSIGEDAFYGCTSLTSINFDDKSQLASIGLIAFSGCTSLESITIPGSVTSIGDSAFSDCSSLESLTIGSGVTSIGRDAFSGCTSLTSINFDDKSQLASIGLGAFKNCNNLTIITIPNSVTSIGRYAFSGCTNLTRVTIPNSVTSIGRYAFSGCTKLNSVTFTNPNGWYRTQYDDGSSPESCYEIPSEYLKNPQTAAEYLKDTYCDHNWKRKS